LPTADKDDTAKLFYVSRLKLLVNCILAAQGDSSDLDEGGGWCEKYMRTPLQHDSSSCGALCLQFVICAVLGTATEIVGSDCDLLRLALVSKMVRAGVFLRQRQEEMEMDG